MDPNFQNKRHFSCWLCMVPRAVHTKLVPFEQQCALCGASVSHVFLAGTLKAGGSLCTLGPPKKERWGPCSHSIEAMRTSSVEQACQGSCRHGQVTSSSLWGSPQGFADVVFLVHYLCIMESGVNMGASPCAYLHPLGVFLIS